MAYSLAQAAAKTGRDRSTLLKAIKRGKLSATRDSATGAWQVDPSELARVYGIGNSEDNSENVTGTAQADSAALIAAKDAQLEEQRETIADLRRRLDTATAQLGEALSQVRALTDQRPARRRWWSWS
jgi:ATP phosphoribosyltransferase regulatory subunit HisZ